MNTEAIRRRHVTFASENHPKDGKERLARKSQNLAEQPMERKKGKRNEDRTAGRASVGSQRFSVTG